MATCRECLAPLALNECQDESGVEPQIVSIVGDSNVGKTVYLGFLLDMLTQRAGNHDAIPVGAYSVDIQQTVITHIANRQFPPKTPMEADQWYWACYKVRERGGAGRHCDLVMPDIAGESLAAEVASPNTFKVIRNLMTRSAGTLLLIDAAQAANGLTQPDFFGIKMLSYIDSINGGASNARIETPTAVVLCKADYCPECFDDTSGFVKANLNRLWNLCENRFANVQFFACSVVGSLGYATAPDEDYVVPTPLHVALQGVLEPFQWIMSQVDQR
jgi:hypothetical protein